MMLLGLSTVVSADMVSNWNTVAPPVNVERISALYAQNRPAGAEPAPARNGKPLTIF